MGLDVSSFLRHGSGSGRQYLDRWKDSFGPRKGGEIVVVFHTRADIEVSYSHGFYLNDVMEDRETGRPKKVLRFTRFNSPDPETVLESQYFRFREKEPMPGRLKILPVRDRFLILREYLRFSGIPNDALIFEWHDPEHPADPPTRWFAGELSGRVKRGKENYGHSLDAKQEYIFVVVEHARPEAGAQITRESKLLGDKVKAEIKKQMESKGEEEGNPWRTPYAFKWTCDPNASSPMNMYDAYRFERAVITDEVWAAITSEEVPDTSALVTPMDGDDDKIRVAMESAAQIDLPFDAIFSDDPNVTASLCYSTTSTRVPVPTGPKTQAAPARPPTRQAAPPSRTVQAPQGGAPVRTPAPTGAQRPAAAPARQVPPRTAPAAAPPPATRTRTRAAAQPPPPPPPPPPEDVLPCEGPENGQGCGFLLPMSVSECPQCGTIYQVDGDAPAGQPPAAAAPAADAPAGAERDPCFACGAPGTSIEADNRCAACGVDQADTIPF